jgi:hypothetical protein
MLNGDNEVECSRVYDTGRDRKTTLAASFIFDLYTGVRKIIYWFLSVPNLVEAQM